MHEGIETIDATGVDTSLLGHSYFAATKTVLSDMFYIINQGQRADERFGLEAVMTGDERRYWRFRKWLGVLRNGSRHGRPAFR